MNEGDGAVFVFDVRKVFLPAADGADQYNADSGMPSVVRAPDGQPGIVIPAGDAPHRGALADDQEGRRRRRHRRLVGRHPRPGRRVGRQDHVRLDLEERLARAGDRLGPAPALASAIEGQTVGSQVLVVVPADQTQADQQALQAPADTALVYVVDILGVVG